MACQSAVATAADLFFIDNSVAGVSMSVPAVRRDTLTSLIVVVLACGMLLFAGGMVLRSQWQKQQELIENHLRISLQSMVQLIELMRKDSVARVKAVAEDPDQRQRLVRLLDRPVLYQPLGMSQAAMLSLYQGRGFDGYSLIAADRQRIIASSDPLQNYGPVTLAATQEALLQAEQWGAAVSRPAMAANGMVFQDACVRIDHEDRLLGYLCLRENAALRLYRILSASHIGTMSEVYVVDDDGRILSPLRSVVQGRRGGAFHMFARVYGRQNEAAPFTAVMTAMRQTRATTNVLFDYPDYRNVRVAGVAQWLPALGMGVVVEESMDEAFGPYYSARDTVIFLLGMALVLLMCLSYVHWRSRRVLTRSEAMMSSFRDNIPAGLHLKDKAGRYLMVSPLFESVFGLPVQSVLGRTDQELFPDAPDLQRQAEHDEVIKTGRTQYSIRSYVNKQGQCFFYNMVRFPVRESGRPDVVSVGTVALDITEQVQAQRHLQELADTLEEKVVTRTAELAAARDQAVAQARERAEFLSNMSHEIRTPLNAMIGMTHLALQTNSSPSTQHYLERVLTSGKYLSDIVSSILDMARMEAGQLALREASFSLEKLLHHVVDVVQVMANAKGLALKQEVGVDVPDVLYGDAMRISQILINFAGNAIKFTEQGWVRLRVTHLQKRHTQGVVALRFEVEDSGAGISAEQLARLFQPFVQLDGFSGAHQEGTGLGLVISKQLAELMGGSVTAKSLIGHGSVFAFDVPLREGNAAEVEGVLPSSAGTAICLHERYGLSGRRVLLVEDDKMNQELVCGLLAQLQVQVTVAECGEQALRLLALHVFDAVLMDVNMPGMDGIVTARRIREDARFDNLPILALTGKAEMESRSDYSHAGMDDYLIKPVDPERLFLALQRFCGVAGFNMGRQSELPWLSPQDALQQLGDICGIDIERGLACTMGRIDLYIRLIVRVTQERADMSSLMLLALRAGKFTQLEELLHSCKSILGSIGAVRLQQQCVEIEQQLTHPVELGRLLGEFDVAYSQLLASCFRWLTWQDALPKDKRGG